VVGSAAAVANLPASVKTLTFAAMTNNVQNGAPDGLCLLDTSNNSILDALSYEGSITAATLAGVPGTVNLVEGMPTGAADDNTTPNSSLSRLPNGSDTDDAATDWVFSTTATPGAANM
jgi:hypothetical protein